MRYTALAKYYWRYWWRYFKQDVRRSNIFDNAIRLYDGDDFDDGKDSKD